MKHPTPADPAAAAKVARQVGAYYSNPLMSTGKAAAYLGVTTRALRRWRMDGCGPSFIELPPAREGGRPIIRYSVADLNDFLATGAKLD